MRAGTVATAVGMLAYMQRTTVKLPDDLDARLRHEAQRRGVTVSQLTRTAIEALLDAPQGRRRLLAVVPVPAGVPTSRRASRRSSPVRCRHPPADGRRRSAVRLRRS